MDVRFSSVQVVGDLKQNQVVGGRDRIPIGEVPAYLEPWW